MGALSYDEILLDEKNRKYIDDNFDIILIMEQMKKYGKEITQLNIAKVKNDYGVKGSKDDIRRDMVRGPFKWFEKMGIITLDPDSIGRNKNKVYNLSELGQRLLKDEHFDILSKMPEWLKYKPKEKPPIARGVIKGYDPEEIKSLMKKVKKELKSVEEPIDPFEHGNYSYYLYRIRNLDFEDDPLYQKLFKYRLGFFPEFNIYLGLLDAYRLELWSWVKQKDVVFNFIREKIGPKMEELKLDLHGPKTDINVYHEKNLSEWIFDGYRNYHEHGDTEKFNHEYKKPKLEWNNNLPWTELRLNGGLILKVSKERDSTEFRSKIEDLLKDLMTIRDDPLSNEFRELVKVYQRKNQINNKMFEVLELIIRKDYSKL